MTVSSDGFAGNVFTVEYGMASFPPPTPFNRIVAHGTLQGFGEFAGQTLRLSYDGPPGGTWTGFVEMH